MTRLRSLRGRSMLITGASSGIGRLIALRAGEGGMRVVLVARREAELDAVAHEIRVAGAEAHALVADVSDRERSAEVVARARAR